LHTLTAARRPLERDAPASQRVLVVGATGTIGRATVRALVARGHHVVCFVRRRPGAPPRALPFPQAVTVRAGDVRDPVSVERDAFAGERFDAVVSCLASRTGAPADAWAVDHAAHVHVLDAARRAGVGHFVLLSAICVQRPRLAFQHAKLAFERQLVASGIRHSVVRPTAFFKSLSGQVERVRRGKPFLVFGDGTLTACKPIADDDVADYLAGCLDDPARWDRVLPVGGPGEAITPRQQGEQLFALLGRAPRFAHVPVRLLDAMAGALGTMARFVPPLEAKAEFARIGRYYATESMLVWDERAERYDAAATPSFGSRTLAEHYRQLLDGEVSADRGEHAVF
jgi:divinyl chlorophyllide a 8-vinyl-reductase